NLFFRSVRRLFGQRPPATQSRLRRFRPTLQLLEDRCVPAVTAMEFPIPTPASGPTNITTGPDGNLWFTEFNADKIGRITPSGILTEFPVTLGAVPNDITVGPDGALYFTEGGLDRIGRITTLGVVTEFSAGITPGSQPAGITLGPDNALWFTELV